MPDPLNGHELVRVVDFLTAHYDQDFVRLAAIVGVPRHIVHGVRVSEAAWALVNAAVQGTSAQLGAGRPALIMLVLQVAKDLPGNEAIRQIAIELGQHTPLPGGARSPPTFDVFLSAASEDYPAAGAMVREIEARGLSCYFAHHRLAAGQEWYSDILKAASGSRLGLFWVTEALLDSAWCAWECGILTAANAVVVPVNAGGSSIEGWPQYIGRFTAIEHRDSRDIAAAVLGRLRGDAPSAATGRPHAVGLARRMSEPGSISAIAPPGAPPPVRREYGRVLVVVLVVLLLLLSAAFVTSFA